MLSPKQAQKLMQALETKSLGIKIEINGSIFSAEWEKDADANQNVELMVILYDTDALKTPQNDVGRDLIVQNVNKLLVNAAMLLADSEVNPLEALAKLACQKMQEPKDSGDLFVDTSSPEEIYICRRYQQTTGGVTMQNIMDIALH